MPTPYDVERSIMLAASKAGARIFKNTTAQGWLGQSTRCSDGSIILTNPRPLKAGLCVGSSDMIGWTMRTVTPDMIGRSVALFTAIEVKSGSGRATPEQLNFIEQVRRAGGISGIARTPVEVHNLLTQMCL